MDDNERDRFEEAATIAWKQGVAAQNWWYAIGTMTAAMVLASERSVRADAIFLHAILHQRRENASLELLVSRRN